MRDRSHERYARWLIAATAGAAVLSGCGADGGGTAAEGGGGTGPPPTASAAAGSADAGTATDSRLPEGTYETRPVTMEEMLATAAASGFDRTVVLADWGIDPAAPLPSGTTVYTLKLQGGRWVQFQTDEGNSPEIGWSGTYEVVDDDTVVATEACGNITYDYALADAVLTLRMVDDQCQGVGESRAGELIAQTVIYSTAPFTKIG